MSLFSYFKKKTSVNVGGEEDEVPVVVHSRRQNKRRLVDSDDSDGDIAPETIPPPETDKEPPYQTHSDRKKPKIQAVPKEEDFPHTSLKWLKHDHLKDKDGHGALHPDYNPRTLKVPQDYIKKLTPGFQQWWTIKADNFDSVIMFKVGKFYELYHMDAVICVQELGLVFMKSDFAHCGFPEAAFGRYSEVLVQKGYKVVRVEQVETPAMMEKRIKKLGASSRSDRVVRREVCSIITKGTRMLNVFGGDSADGQSVFLLAIKESPCSDRNEFGVCFVDTCIGTIHVGQFKDDSLLSRLRTLLAHYPPGHLLYERRGLKSHTAHLFDILLPSCIRDALSSDTEFWGANKTMKELAESGYFHSGDSSGIDWPPTIRKMLDASGLGVVEEFELAVSAMGACVWCLSRAHIDHTILSLANFKLYNPLDVASDLGPCGNDPAQKMILDDVTLCNLDVIGLDGNQTGTLLEKLDNTVTAFGRRLLRQWVCSPPASPSAIVLQQDAVDGLAKNPPLMAKAKSILCKLPDLERLLRKIHALGCTSRCEDLPDSRAIFFEHVMYSKRKIADFIAVLDGLRSSLKVLDVFNPELRNMNSLLLFKCLSIESEGKFPNIEKHLDFYDGSFDKAKAKEEGVIVPCKGVSPEYDSSHEEVELVLEELERYLREQRHRLGCQNVTYWGTGRNRFQLEIPVPVISRQSIEEYELTSQRKGFRRYRTPATEEMLKRLTAAEEKRDRALRDTMGELFCSFDQHFSLWDGAVSCLAMLDVLMSLATYSSSLPEPVCRPTITQATFPILEICEGRHPCIVHTHMGGDFIPNSITYEAPANCLIVTGPNMGGKSTLMRQTGLLVILSQLGCYVPAAKCLLSPVDRVFTRMGASDRIMAKESTFFVELKETCSILQHATLHSLVLMDELGRGTATYDGAAIASAVVQQLALIRCRTLFSTHYHFLVDQLVDHPSVQLGYMACVVEEEGKEESITFLYKLTQGVCPKSYGFHVAQLAGLPSTVITAARKKAGEFETTLEQVKTLRKLFLLPISISDLKLV